MGVLESELDRERAVVSRLYRRLDELRAETEERLARVRRDSVGSNHQARSERDAFARLYEDQLTQLRDVDARLVFGRLLLDEAVDGSDHRYIGRIGLRDDDQRSLLVDWRAQQAGAFYQATASERMGVRARRHLTMSGRQVTRIDDEVFDEALLDGERAGEQVQGEGALLAALTAQRTGRMHDIVATIQAEQDRIIRSDLRGALVVQGGPGTGKTAVALHRAAYLLYANRQRLSASGVLVVGPSTAFLRYIEAVLPSLGETGVVMSSLGELFPGVEATAEDAPEAAVLKGSAQMARLLSRAVKSRQKAPAEAQTIVVDNERLVVEPELVHRAIAKAQRTGKPHNVARVTFVKHALAELTDQLAAQLRAGGSTIDDADLKVLREDLRTSYDVRVLLNTAWLPLTPQKLLQDLYARPAWLAELTPRWTDAQRRALQRDRSEPFTVSDVPLLDEAAELLGDFPGRPDPADRERDRQRKRDLENARAAIRNMGVQGLVSAEQLADGFAEQADRGTTAERAASDRSWTYGHVVVDEAQELSPMQWRVLVRRCPMKSFTIVGDIAQVASAAGASSWQDALNPVFKDAWRLEELTVNYRTPAQITREAERVAAEAGLPITPTRAVREGDWPIRRVAAAAPDAQALAGAVADAVAHDRGIDGAGTLAVITTAADLPTVSAAVGERFGEQAGRGAAGLSRPIAVLTGYEAKGLEFDAVVLADPDALAAESPRGAASLYVAMTRPTQRLTLVSR
ncbi:UvrD-helicase domain-containing protein [Leifsonia shinshuensis]|uniref:HelD family protein n=1 Tax=Leifsonia shinshuensis TaxID=150026 RepID=UPI002856CCEF|nr:UvrD-helicase domain-containing protein [Leifsonia shinshuensis]MDR6971535.1 DNA helicase IV [Leifsonia shinshuensis]